MNLSVSTYGNADGIFAIKTFLMLCSATERSLVERILGNPNDALSREAYSDFLEENSRVIEAKAERERVKEIRNPQRKGTFASGDIPSVPSVSSVSSGTIHSGSILSNPYR